MMISCRHFGGFFVFVSCQISSKYVEKWRILDVQGIFEFYRRELGDLDGVAFMPIQPWNKPNYWLSCITLSGKVRPIDVMEHLRLQTEARNMLQAVDGDESADYNKVV